MYHTDGQVCTLSLRPGFHRASLSSGATQLSLGLLGPTLRRGNVISQEENITHNFLSYVDICAVI